MNQEQVVNFVYWLSEYHNLRGIRDKKTPIEQMLHTKTLIDMFFEKYPTGILTGWTRVEPSENNMQA